MKRKITFLIAALFALMLITQSLTVKGQAKPDPDPTVLFHETFGDNSGSARAWSDTYSVKSGISTVYSGITSYTVSNVKQGKNTTGKVKSGLNQSSQGTDAYIEIGPLNVLNYTSLNVDYWWKAGSIAGTYTTKLYYKTSSNGNWTEVSGTGSGATSFVERSYSLPAACQVSTLYLKAVWNTSNTQAIIDEFELNCPTYTVTYDCNGGTSGCPDSPVNAPSGTFTLASAPTRSGFTFTGWNDGTNTYNAGASYTLSGNKTFTAQWESSSSVATPTFSVSEGTYYAAQSVELECVTEGASIYYTTNGSTPSSSSTLYTGTAISVSTTNTTIKAIAIKDGLSDSEVAEATYVIKVATPTFTVDEGTYLETQSVELNCATVGATIHYTTDGTAPTSSSPTYTSAISVATSQTIKAIAIKSNWTNSEVAEAEYTIKVKTPTFSPVAGVYTSAQNVTLSCATSEATIKYSTNNGETWTTYSSAIEVSATTTIKAKAEKTGLADSDVASSTFTIVTIHDVAWALANSGEEGVYVSGIVSHFNITRITGDGSNYRYYISDDGTTTSELLVYKGKNQFNQNFSDVNDLLVGDEVVITGDLTTYNDEVEFASGNHLVYIKPVIKKETVSLTTFTYSHGNGPSEYQSFTVRGRNLTENLVVTASSDYEVCATSDGTYTSSISLSTTNSTTKTVYVRLKAGLGIGTHNGTITMTSSDAVTQTVDITGSVSGYTVTYAGNGNTSGTVPTDDNVYEKNEEVTVLGAGDLAKIGYEFAWWENEDGDPFEEDDTFEITENTTLTAQWSPVTYSYTINKTGDDASVTAKLQVWNGSAYVDAGAQIACDAQVKVVVTPSQAYYTYTLAAVDGGSNVVAIENDVFTMPANTVAVTVTTRRLYTITYPGSYTNGEVTESPTSAYAGANIVIETTPSTNYYLSAVTTSAGSPVVNGNNIEFTMPASDVTITAITFARIVYTVTYSVNGDTEEIAAVNVNAGESIATLPTSVTPPSGFTFAGWTESGSMSVKTGSYKPTSTCTLYAVYAKTGQTAYILVESDLGTDWAGDYLIAYNDETFADGREGGTSGMGAEGSSVNPGDNLNGKIINETWGNTYNITLEEISNNSNTYLLITKDGKYNYQSSNNNGLAATDNRSTATPYPISITYNSSSDIDLNVSGTTFSYNSGGNGYFRFYKNSGANQNDVYLYKKQTMIDYYTSVITETTTTATADINPSVTGPVIIPSGKTLDMSTFTLTNINPANLVIENEGQLICSNQVAATFNKSIDAPAAKTEYNSWYTISSPVTDGTHDYIAIASLPSLTAVDYDMLAYDEVNHTWRNQKNIGGASGFSNMNKGQGYMYRNDDSDISFVGTTNTGTFSNNLSYTAGAGDLAGFHLVGNPYSHNITLMNTTLLDDGGDPYETQLGGCYILTNTNSWGVSLGTSSPIKPTQGFLIQITTDDVKKIQFSETPRAAKSRSNGDNIEFIVSNSEYEDNTFALFDNVMGLNKIDHRNTEVPMIYIPQYGTNYAIAPMSDDTQMFGLNFKAATMGQYTLSMKAAGEYNYIHVIDRLTGEDIDMLLEGKYSVIGSPRDNESRFLVKLGYVPGSTNNNNEIFAYQSGSDIVVTGSGELQIFDVTGRSVMTTTINGVETIQVPTTGMYIFRLIGSDVKTQKIVVE